MHHVGVIHSGELAIVTLQRGRVNALDGDMVCELSACLDELERQESVRGMVLTGAGKFFSFGFDVPQLEPLSEELFTRFVCGFTRLYTALYAFPKPVVAALNGHAVAGGCMIATAADYRLMAAGRGKISLNEITFGSSVFAGSVEILQRLVGHRNAEKMLYSGAMYGPEEALGLGLVDAVIPPGDLMDAATAKARELAGREADAFSDLKRLLRGPVVETMRRREADSIREFVRIWYSEATRKRLACIEIRNS